MPDAPPRPERSEADVHTASAEGPPVTVVVVVTNSGAGDRLDRCLTALLTTEEPAASILVVDNSGAPVAPVAERWGPHGVEVLTTPNAGYGAAANVAVADPRTAAADAIALLNDDVVVEPGWLGSLRSTLGEDAGVGAVQPKLLVAGSAPAVVNSLGVTFDEHGAGVDIGDGLPDAEAPTEAHDIDMFTAGAVLLRRGFLDDVGGFDERYFMYYEDADLALRGREWGWRYRCEPAAVVWHERGATSAAIPDRRRFLQERNRLVVSFRFGSVAVVARGLWLSVRRLRHRPRRVHARALAAGLGRAPRALAERRRSGR